MSINAQSIADLDHMKILRRYLASECIDLVGVSETWLKEKHDNAKLYDIDGYELFRHDRPASLMRAGGVAFYAKKSLKLKIISKSDYENENSAEYLLAELKSQGDKLLFAIVYRRPFNHVKLTSFVAELEQHHPSYNHTILMGDFNINFANNTLSMLRTLEFDMEQLGIERLPINDTNLSHNALTTVDAILVSKNCEVVNFGKFDNLLSSHDILYAVVDVELITVAAQTKMIREFDKIDQNILEAEALKIDWTEGEMNLHIDDRVKNFNDKLHGLFDKVSPKKMIKTKTKFKPSLPDDIRVKIRERNAAKKQAARSQNTETFSVFKKLRNQVKQMTLKFHNSVIHKGLKNVIGKKHIWNKLRNLGLIKSKNHISDLPVTSDELAQQLTVKQDAEILANLNGRVAPRDSNRSGDPFYFKYVTPIEVKRAIFDIDSSAEGVDKTCIQMLKRPVNIILPALTFIMNLALQTSVFPAPWKRAILKPIPKVRKPTIADFRPISILCAASKVLEKLVYNQVLDYLSNNNVFDQFQSGFRKMHSTATALLKITEDLRLNMFKGEVTIIVFLDFSKAFDLVDHGTLVQKLEAMNFSKPVITFFKSYLSGRSHAIKNPNGTFSKWINIECGVPQGSVCGPLLFSLFISDLSKVLKNRCRYHLYADDLQLYLNMSCKPDEVSNCVNLVNEILADVFEWSSQNGLKLNPKKSQAMLIGSEKNYAKIDFTAIPKLSLNNVQLDFCEKVKNLGIVFDRHLSWNPQIAQITQKVIGTLITLDKFRDATPEKVRITLVKSLILPHFDYCDIALCNLNIGQIEKLQVLQNHAIRYIYNVKFGHRLSKFYKKAEILKVEDRRNLSILMQTHKILYKNCPEYLNDFATTMYDVNLAGRTRAHKMTLLAPFVSVEVPELCFKVLSYRLWNKLKPELCLNPNINAFKSALKKEYYSEY
jgi:hypothetical protein